MKNFAYALLLSFALCQPALAGDKEALDHYNKAMKHWKDPDPTRAIKSLEKAVDQASRKDLRLNFLLMLGQLHQGKTGDFDKALSYYERIVRKTIGAKKPNIKNLKAQAIYHKATILYSRGEDPKIPLQMYQDAYATYPTAMNTDVLSQMFFRLARDRTKTQGARDKQLETARKLSEEAIQRDAREQKNRKRGQKNPAVTAKYQLQGVIVLKASGKDAEANALWSKIKKRDLNDNSLYQQAVLQALRGEEAGAIAKTLKKAMRPAVRPKARARNQLRHFIRTEPDFGNFLKHSAWKSLVTDEPGGSASSRPTSRRAR